MRRLCDMRWPSERENIETSVAMERGLTVDESFRRILGLASVAARLPRAPDPIGDADERTGSEAYARWIRARRARS